MPKKKGSAVYFDLRDIHPQCANCNVWQRGNLHAYYDYMLDTYGQDVIDELKQLGRTSLKITRDEYADRIKAMRELIQAL